MEIYMLTQEQKDALKKLVEHLKKQNELFDEMKLK